MAKVRKVLRIYAKHGVFIDLPWQINTPSTWLGISVIDMGVNVRETTYSLQPLNETTELVLERIDKPKT